MADDEVATEVIVDDGRGAGPGRMIVLRLVWHRCDPLAIVLLLIAQPDHPALPRGRWVALRDFLRYGLEEPTGDGDVRIRPEKSRDRVCLELARDGRPCQVFAPRELVRSFLDATEDLVPAGAEGSEVAIDRLITRLLSDEE